MNDKTRDYIIIGILLCVLGATTYIMLTSDTGDKLDAYSQYASAPDCMGKFPSEPGICKYTETTWLICDYSGGSNTQANILTCNEIPVPVKK